MFGRLNEAKLSEFITAKVSANDAFSLLDGLSVWLRQGGSRQAADRVAAVRRVLENDRELCEKTATLLLSLIHI